MTAFFHTLGGTGIFVWEVMRTAFSTRGNYAPVMAQVASICLRSLPTVAFAGIFVGAILVLQFDLILAKYDAQIYLGGLNTAAVVREVGPLIISFLLAGKIGAYTTAELGTMRVTEQIDAIECLGTNPIQYLIVPRFFGILISTLILLCLGLLISVGSAMVVAHIFSGINFLQYGTAIPRFVNYQTVLGGMLRSEVYGLIVAAVACYQGYTASGGARGVGRAVTQSAIYTNFYIVMANFVTGTLLEAVGFG